MKRRLHAGGRIDRNLLRLSFFKAKETLSLPSAQTDRRVSDGCAVLGVSPGLTGLPRESRP